ncbi:hypothetical protein DM01DRAFT_1272379, partial [Hesseltinella vesiculosa]
RLLNTRSFVELTNEHCQQLLNYDWNLHLCMKHVTSQLLAGCFLRLPSKKAIVVNTVEVYGRKKHVDIHREPFGNLKHAITITSLPPSFARYKNVWPTTIHNEGPKLVIGTLTLNALITSSIRVDCIATPSV